MHVVFATHKKHHISTEQASNLQHNFVQLQYFWVFKNIAVNNCVMSCLDTKPSECTECVLCSAKGILTAWCTAPPSTTHKHNLTSTLLSLTYE